MTTDTKVTARAKAFSCEGVREQEFMVSDDGVDGELQVRARNDIDGTWTLCHSLGKGAQARIIRASGRDKNTYTWRTDAASGEVQAADADAALIELVMEGEWE